MAQINISSNNQSGGITAHTVASGNVSNAIGSKTVKPKARRIAFWVKTVAAILASAAAIAAAIH